jgi:hypothetical protein
MFILYLSALSIIYLINFDLFPFPKTIVNPLTKIQDLIHTMLPRTTRTQRACKRNVDKADCDPSCAYYKLIKDVSDLYELSAKESKS